MRKLLNAQIAQFASITIALLLAFFIMTFPIKAQVKNNQEFRATPMFFATRSKEERCSAIDTWIQSIIYEARLSVKARKGYSQYNGNDEEVMKVVNRDIDKRQLALIHFRNVFGKPLHELSEKERKEIAKSLENCTSEYWIKSALTSVITLPLDSYYNSELKEWFAMSERYEEKEIAKQKSAEYIQSLPENMVNQDRSYFDEYENSVLLLNTDSYRLYGKYPEKEWCTEHQAYLVLVFKADESYEVKSNTEYMQRFDSEIFPEILKHCKPSSISIEHHIAGKYINSDKISDKPDSRGWKSEGINSVIFHNFDPSTNKYKYTDWSREIYSIAGLRKEPEMRELRKKEYQAKEKVRQEENQRKAEIKRQEIIKAKTPVERIKAATVLRLLETAKINNTSATYDFTGYKQKSDLNNIFIGNFKLFTEDYEVEDLERAVSTLNATEMFNISSLRSSISMAYVAYHRAFEDNCRANNDIPWQEANFRRPGTVTTNGLGMEVGRTREETYQFFVREPFAESFKNTYIAINNGDAIAQYMVGITEIKLQAYKTDFKNFLAVEKCSSPAVRQLEVNLYLANQWMLPLQVLYQPSKAENPKKEMQKPKPQIENQKSTPKPRNTKGKVRGKN